MKKALKPILIFLLVSTLLSGCFLLPPSETEETGPIQGHEHPLELVIILGSHQNAWLSLDELRQGGSEATEFAELIARTMEYSESGSNYRAKCHVQIVVCDGEPSTAQLLKANGKDLELEITSPNRNYIRDVHIELADDIAKALQHESLRANHEGVDLVSALIHASYLFKTDDSYEHRILIMDTGLCTEGPLNMIETDIQASYPKEIINGLNSSDFARLEGINVEFRNLADFCGAQPVVFDPVLIDTLSSVWETYLEKCGAQDYIVEFNANEYDRAADSYDKTLYLNVPVVDFTVVQDGMTIRSAKYEFDPVEDADLVLNDDTVGGFEGSSFTPVDEEKARALIAEKKEFLDAILDIYPDCKFYVIGSCSYPNDNKPHDTYKDAEGRANTIARYLREAGVPEDRIIAVDAGTNRLPWRCADEYTEKDQNRVVAIIPSYRREIIEDLHAVLGNRIPLEEAATPDA